MDLRWQLVLDCLGCTTPPFSKGTFVTSRNALLPYHLDRRLLERTLEIAQQTGAFNPRALRGALDSSPLGGAGRVEDTYNLLGHAMRKTVDVLAAAQGREPAAVAAAAGAALAQRLQPQRPGWTVTGTIPARAKGRCGRSSGCSKP